MRNIFFYGELARKYGSKFVMKVDSFSEMVSLMTANFSDFRKTIMPNRYALVVGKDLNGYNIKNEQEAHIKFGDGDFHFVPEGCGAGGELSFILGAVITVVGVLVPALGTYLIPIGVGLMLGGISAMLAPTIDGHKDNEDQKTSIVYSGGVNNMEQGGPVPLVYGRVMAGSVVVSVDVDVFEYADESLSLGSDGYVSDFSESGGGGK